MRNFIFITLTALILCKTDCLLAQSKFPAAEECENKTNKEGKRAGKWLIPYKEYNWENSKLKVAFDVNNLDEIKLNPTSNNYDPNQLDPNQICFLENVSYKNGLKHGSFLIFGENGNIVSQKEFRYGKQISMKGESELFTP